MKALRIVFRMGLLIGLGLEFPGWPTTAQTTSPKEAQPQASGLRKPIGDARAQRRFTEGAARDAYDRDADLYCRKKMPRIIGELERRISASAAFLMKLLQPRLAR